MLLNLPIILSSKSFLILPIIPIFILFYSHLFPLDEQSSCLQLQTT